MNRRDLLNFAALTAAGALAAPAAFSQSAPLEPIDVVKVMSFSCEFCRSAEAQGPLIEKAVRARRGRFVRAPIAATASSPGYREQVYYAARELDESFSERVKLSLYRGTQEALVALEAYVQVYYWLLQDMPEEEQRLNRLIELAQQPAAAAALQRAVSLTISAGVERLPTYVMLSRGTIVATLDTSTTGAKSMAGLREAVIEKLQTI
jgi:hypothetical protein